MQTRRFRDIQRDKGKAVATDIAAGEAVAVDSRAMIVPASWLDIETDEQPISCSNLSSSFMQKRISEDRPIPIRFGQSSKIKAWLISLARWEAIR